MNLKGNVIAKRVIGPTYEISPLVEAYACK